MSSQPQVDLLLSPQAFFKERIVAASSQLNVKLDDEVEFYLVNLLTEFINPTPLNQEFASDVLDTPLVFLLQQAHEAPDSKKPIMYRRLGDTSLYITGFFQDYFNDKAFDINYFMTMGASAYSHAALLLRSHGRDPGHTSILSNIADNFVQVVDVVAQASDSPETHKATDILHIYDRWTRCKSDRLRNILQEHGITPVSIPYKIAQ